MKKAYAEKRFFEWHEDELAVSLRAKSGSYGGGSEVLVIDTLVFDESSITSPVNGNVPQWGGRCHTLSREAGRSVIIIKYEDSNGTCDNSAKRRTN